MRTIIAITAILCSVGAAGYNRLDDACDAEISKNGPTEEEFNPQTHADNFCALLRYKPESAVAQLNKMIRTTRRFENPRRYYFDPLLGNPRPKTETYVQIWRPWMDDAAIPIEIVRSSNGNLWISLVQGTRTLTVYISRNTDSRYYTLYCQNHRGENIRGFTSMVIRDTAEAMKIALEADLDEGFYQELPQNRRCLDRTM